MKIYIVKKEVRYARRIFRILDDIFTEKEKAKEYCNKINKNKNSLRRTWYEYDLDCCSERELIDRNLSTYSRR